MTLLFKEMMVLVVRLSTDRGRGRSTVRISTMRPGPGVMTTILSDQENRLVNIMRHEKDCTV